MMDGTSHHIIAAALDAQTPKRKRASNAPAMCAELLKLLRSEALTDREIAADLNWDRNTVGRWLREMTTNGLLAVERPAKVDTSQPGYAARVYRLSKQWGGA